MGKLISFLWWKYGEKPKIVSINMSSVLCADSRCLFITKEIAERYFQSFSTSWFRSIDRMRGQPSRLQYFSWMCTCFLSLLFPFCSVLFIFIHICIILDTSVVSAMTLINKQDINRRIRTRMWKLREINSSLIRSFRDI